MQLLIMSDKIQQHHYFLIEKLAREAEIIYRSKTISSQQRYQAKQEAKSFNEIALFLRKHCKE